MTVLRRSGPVACALAVAALAACGGRSGPLDEAEEAMAGLDAGRMGLQLTATAGSDQSAGPVGFRVEGPFSFASEGELPVLDLRYTQLLGGEEVTTRVVSTGATAYVEAGGKVTEVGPGDAGALRLGPAGGGFGDLGIAGWVEDPTVEDRPDGTKVVSGTADVADLLSDLARIGAQVAGGTAPDRLDGDAARRLGRLARSSRVVVEVAADDLPRSVRAVVDFGGRVPEALRQALGPYAAARLELTVSLERLEQPLEVEPPGA